MTLFQRHFLSDADFSASDIETVLHLAGEFKSSRSQNAYLSGKHLALVLEKTSTRTRIAFEVAMKRQGGFVTTLDYGMSQLGLRESIADTASVLDRIYDVIAYRGIHHDEAQTLSHQSSKPVINALTDIWHPTQALADYFTMYEVKNPSSWKDVNVAYVGDGHNNVANSLLTTGALLGANIRIAAPESLQPEFTIEARALEAAAESGARILITEDPLEAVLGADFVYTDVWVSMGEPIDAWNERINLLRDYQVNSALMNATKNSEAKFLHCLPAIHDSHTEIGQQIASNYGITDGVEVTDEVFKSPASIVFQQAENRLYTIEALLVLLASETYRQDV
ncbi:MAG: ornithine carbamoyltransferase 1 [Actinomycetota bacterium]